jgi:type I restriction enzyme S subunit
MIETKFKPTEIGLIPEDWGCIKFGETIKFISNNTLSRDFLCDDGAIKNIHYGDVLIKYSSVLDVRNSQIPAVNEALTTFKLRNVAQDGDIIIADTAEDETVCKATELYNIGDCKVVSGLHTMWCRPQDGLFAGKYLGYFFNASIYHNQVLPYIQGIKVSSVSKSAIQDTFILVPDYSEQQRIASALTSIDNLLSSLDKLIAKKRDIKQGTMQQLLTGKTRLKGFTEPWVEKKLNEVLDYEQPTKYLVSSSEYEESGTPVLTAGKTFILGYTTEKNGIYNKLPVIIFDDFTTDSKYVTFPFKAKSSAMKMLKTKNENVNLRLIYELMQMLGYVPGDHQRHWISIYSKLSISMPSAVEEQQAISSVLSSIDNEIAALEAKRKKYESVKQGMMQQLLTGKIRLL